MTVSNTTRVLFVPSDVIGAAEDFATEIYGTVPVSTPSGITGML
jgi:hypothetical protein